MSVISCSTSFETRRRKAKMKVVSGGKILEKEKKMMKKRGFGASKRTATNFSFVWRHHGLFVKGGQLNFDNAPHFLFSFRSFPA